MSSSIPLHRMKTERSSSKRRKPSRHIDPDQIEISYTFSPTTTQSPTSTTSFSSAVKRNNSENYFDPNITQNEWTNEVGGKRVKYEDYTTIDFMNDISKERVRLKHVREREHINWRGWMESVFDKSIAWIVVALIGIAAGLIAVFIDVAGEWLSDLKQGKCKGTWYLNRKFCCWMEEGTTHVASLFFYALFGTFFAVSSAVLVKSLAPYAAGSGIPEVKTILGGFVIRKFLGGWTLIVKAVGLALSTASGLSLGKEGPMVHLSCCFGNILSRCFDKFKRNEAKRREILSAAAAAGVSVAFGSPIGGVLFSLEEVSYYFPYKTMLRSFFCAMMGAVTLQIMNPFRTGKLVIFEVSYTKDWRGFELIFFVLLGVIGGLIGSLFIKFNLRVTALRKNSSLKDYPIQEVLVVALVSALINYTNIYTRGSISELVFQLFNDCQQNTFVTANLHGLCDDSSFASTAVLLLFAAACKLALTIFTFGLRVPCGVFIPSFAIGACTGRVLGMMVHLWQKNYPDFFLFAACRHEVPCISLGQYALVGAAAVLAGVTRMTVSLVVIMFELTGALTYVLPIMITVMTAKFVADAVGGKESIYDGLIRLNMYPYLDNKEEYIESYTAAQVMTRAEQIVILTSTGMTLDSIDELLHDTDYNGFPVVNNIRDMLLVGYINRSELKYAANRAKKYGLADFREWMDHTPITLVPKFPMEMVIEMFRKMGLRYVLVTLDGKLYGIITKKDVLRHLGRLDDSWSRKDTIGEVGGHSVAERRRSIIDDDEDKVEEDGMPSGIGYVEG
ncbi:chloride channel [Paraphysoderma sedebokerense]|nr:chloride channel [Paraphysoderma sedebokerense]